MVSDSYDGPFEDPAPSLGSSLKATAAQAIWTLKD
jgi:hypothetical protein